MDRPKLRIALASCLSVILTISVAAAAKKEAISKESQTPALVAKQIDEGILAELQKANVPVAELCNDSDFLRRTSLDITGQLPSPHDVVTFTQNTDPDKRRQLIDRLVDSPEFGVNWGRYWRDVIYIRATEQRSRLNQSQFEDWMATQWNHGTGWDATVTSILTATGDVQEHPETALVFAQGADAEEIAAEASRIFLGIQIQCANCHDHPSDIWKRDQFHQLAAYFPRISERRIATDKAAKFEIASMNNDRRPGDFVRENPELLIRRFDRNGDQKVSKEELLAGPAMRRAKKAAMMENKNELKLNPKIIDRMFEFGDSNKDGLLTADEIKNIPAPDMKRRGSAEHHMVDLKHPNEEGQLVDPKFFVDGSSLPHGKTDEERRQAVAQAFTSSTNPWFARAIVNRVWAEMLGEGFYMPIDDMGPNRSARYPEVLDLICQGFVANDHDPKWLIRTIANTATYQRKIQFKSEADNALPFASATPFPLRADVVFNSLQQVFGMNEAELQGGRAAKAAKKAGEMEAADASAEMKDEKPKMAEMAQAMKVGARLGFDALFGVDPSVPKEEITGTIPQSLMMMNSRRFRAGMSARGNSRLGVILKEHKDNKAAIRELFLLVFAREPSERETGFCMNYVAEVKDRPEAFEDIMWTLLNSSEFISRR